MAAYAVLLGRYTNCTDVTIGTTFLNRHDWRFAGLIGATLDVAALRFDLSGDPGVPDLLRQVRQGIADALKYQDVPLDRIIPERPRKPLFRAVCSYFDRNGARPAAIAGRAG